MQIHRGGEWQLMRIHREIIMGEDSPLEIWITVLIHPVFGSQPCHVGDWGSSVCDVKWWPYPSKTLSTENCKN